jgi:hypothetical protein
MTVQKVEVIEYKCDRCGAAGDFRKPVGLEIDYGWLSLAFSEAERRDLADHAGIPTRFDLCPRCSRDFTSWFFMENEVRGLRTP